MPARFGVTLYPSLPQKSIPPDTPRKISRKINTVRPCKGSATWPYSNGMLDCRTMTMRWHLRTSPSSEARPWLELTDAERAEIRRERPAWDGILEALALAGICYWVRASRVPNLHR